MAISWKTQGITNDALDVEKREPLCTFFFFFFFEARKRLSSGSQQTEDGRLAPQNNHLIWVWMPGFFIDQRDRSNEELKSKGRIEGGSGEVQWKDLQSCKTSSREWPVFGRGMLISSILRWAGTNSLHELNTGTLVYSPGEGQPGVLQPMGLQSQTGLSDWTELNWKG